MGMYIRQDDKRSKLQEKIAADLRAKAAERAKSDIQSPEYDGEKDASIVQNTQQSSPMLGVWSFIAVLIIGGVIFFAVG